jgi:hypothetical protein
MMPERVVISFEPAQLDYVANLLAARPWSEVQALLADIRQQVQANNEARAHAATGMQSADGGAFVDRGELTAK